MCCILANLCKCTTNTDSKNELKIHEKIIVWNYWYNKLIISDGNLYISNWTFGHKADACFTQNPSQNKCSAVTYVVNAIVKFCAIDLKFLECDDSYLETNSILDIVYMTKKIKNSY